MGSFSSFEGHCCFLTCFSIWYTILFWMWGGAQSRDKCNLANGSLWYLLFRYLLYFVVIIYCSTGWILRNSWTIKWACPRTSPCSSSVSSFTRRILASSRRNTRGTFLACRSNEIWQWLNYNATTIRQLSWPHILSKVTLLSNVSMVPIWPKFELSRSIFNSRSSIFPYLWNISERGEN